MITVLHLWSDTPTRQRTRHCFSPCIAAAAAPRAAPDTVDGLLAQAVATAGGASGPGLRCPLCGVSIQRRSNLRRHIAQQHFNERPHTCKYPSCGARFARKADLEKHVRTHTGDRPYPCDECGRAFRCSSELHAHRRTHAPLERRFFCPIAGCPKSFLRRYSLRMHLRGHGLNLDAARAQAAAAEPKCALDDAVLPESEPVSLAAAAVAAAAAESASAAPAAAPVAAALSGAHAQHRHGINCGHVIVRHGDHVDVVDRGMLWELDLATGAAMRPHGPRHGSEDRKRPRPDPCPVHGTAPHIGAQRAKLPAPASLLSPPGREDAAPSHAGCSSLSTPPPNPDALPDPSCSALADPDGTAAEVDAVLGAGACSCWPGNESVGLISPLGPCGEAVDVLEGESLEPLTEDDLLILQVAARARQRGFSEELSRFPP